MHPALPLLSLSTHIHTRALILCLLSTLSQSGISRQVDASTKANAERLVSFIEALYGNSFFDIVETKTEDWIDLGEATGEKVYSIEQTIIQEVRVSANESIVQSANTMLVEMTLLIAIMLVASVVMFTVVTTVQRFEWDLHYLQSKGQPPKLC